MKAYKKQLLNPNKHRLMPSEYPWITEEYNPQTTYSDEWTIVTDEEYQDIVSTYTELYNLCMKNIIEEKIKSAMIFGNALMVEFGAMNTMRNLTIEQVGQAMLALAPVKAALDSGSLYVAISLLESLTPDGTVIRAQDIQYFKNKIQAFLGIDLT